MADPGRQLGATNWKDVLLYNLILFVVAFMIAFPLSLVLEAIL